MQLGGDGAHPQWHRPWPSGSLTESHRSHNIGRLTQKFGITVGLTLGITVGLASGDT